jgi:hypothetical protein
VLVEICRDAYDERVRPMAGLEHAIDRLPRRTT